MRRSTCEVATAGRREAGLCDSQAKEAETLSLPGGSSERARDSGEWNAADGIVDLVRLADARVHFAQGVIASGECSVTGSAGTIGWPPTRTRGRHGSALAAPSTTPRRPSASTWLP